LTDRAVIDFGPFRVRVQSGVEPFIDLLGFFYKDSVLHGEHVVDYDIRMMPARGIRRFVGRQILFEIDEQVAPGEIVILTGPSGSGKTTLLTLIGALRSTQEGSVKVLGKELDNAKEKDLIEARRKIGYIFQTHNLIPVLTAYENVELPTLLLKLTSAQRRQRVELALQAVGLADRADHYPRQLSGGQEQRVGIARAIVAHPQLVVADEPTGSLDADTSEQIQVLLKRLNQELEITMLMVTHDPDVAGIASRRLLLDHGHFRDLEQTTPC